MKLFLFRLARMQGETPVPGYLLQMDDGTNVLIDTGYTRSAISLYHTHPDIHVHMDKEDSIIYQLASLGLAPSDIDYVICSHFDPDHAGNHDAFRHAQLVVQRKHYEIARQGTYPRLTQTFAGFDQASTSYLFVEGDTDFMPGIRLIETSGHVPGHQSVLIHLPQTGPVLLAIDAIARTTDLDAETRAMSAFDMDAASVRASTRKLTSIAERENVKLIICGHDREQWEHLKKAPAFYM